MTAIERARGELAVEPDDVSSEQARAVQVAATRKHRRHLIHFVIRLASLAIVRGAAVIATRFVTHEVLWRGCLIS